MTYRIYFRSTALLLTLFGLAACGVEPTLEVPAEYQLGQKNFHRICANCHGPDAMGKKTPAPRLIDEEYLAPNFTDDDIRHTVKEGTGKMPPQRTKVTDAEISEIIKYLRYSQKAAGLSADTEDDDEEDGESPA